MNYQRYIPVIIVGIWINFVASLLQVIAEVHHGVWFWGSTTLPDLSPSPYGSSDVVGDAAKENDLILFFDAYSVKRVYGSYQNRPISEPAGIANWNMKLDAAGIDSQILIDGDAVNSTSHVASLLDKITNRLIQFNADLGTNDHQKFDALHLDIEPQKLSLWDTGTVVQKRGLLDDLVNVYTNIRSLLDSSGASETPIYADIPYFWDKLPVDGGSVGWTNAADRDGWYASLAGPLEGVSIMTFSKASFSSIETATAYERTGDFSNVTRIGIQGKVGPTEVWTNYIHFISTLNELDSAYGPDESTDIENLAFWRSSIESFGPIITTAPIISVTGTLTTNLVIQFTGVPGYIYTVKASTNYTDWEPIRVYQTASTQLLETLHHPLILTNTFSVQRIERTEAP